MECGGEGVTSQGPLKLLIGQALFLSKSMCAQPYPFELETEIPPSPSRFCHCSMRNSYLITDSELTGAAHLLWLSFRNLAALSVAHLANSELCTSLSV